MSTTRLNVSGGHLDSPPESPILLVPGDGFTGSSRRDLAAVAALDSPMTASPLCGPRHTGNGPSDSIVIPPTGFSLKSPTARCGMVNPLVLSSSAMGGSPVKENIVGPMNVIRSPYSCGPVIGVTLSTGKSPAESDNEGDCRTTCSSPRRTGPNSGSITGTTERQRPSRQASVHSTTSAASSNSNGSAGRMTALLAFANDCYDAAVADQKSESREVTELKDVREVRDTKKKKRTSTGSRGGSVSGRPDMHSDDEIGDEGNLTSRSVKSSGRGRGRGIRGRGRGALSPDIQSNRVSTTSRALTTSLTTPSLTTSLISPSVTLKGKSQARVGSASNPTHLNHSAHLTQSGVNDRAGESRAARHSIATAHPHSLSGFQPHSTRPHSTQPHSTQPHSTQPDSTRPQSTQPHSTFLLSTCLLHQSHWFS
eukprot:GHVN01030413.1.p1 GENE.GHVN01030413.1~~GHVN01030413.1.p1  ORF type:complete len:424 (+),score=126.79 GHVN01030413.1:297-1568(+)